MEGRDVDPYAFLADQDPDPAVFFNADRIRIQLFFSMRTGSGSSCFSQCGPDPDPAY